MLHDPSKATSSTTSRLPSRPAPKTVQPGMPSCVTGCSKLWLVTGTDRPGPVGEASAAGGRTSATAAASRAATSSRALVPGPALSTLCSLIDTFPSPCLTLGCARGTVPADGEGWTAQAHGPALDTHGGVALQRRALAALRPRHAVRAAAVDRGGLVARAAEWSVHGAAGHQRGQGRAVVRQLDRTADHGVGELEVAGGPGHPQRTGQLRAADLYQRGAGRGQRPAP